MDQREAEILAKLLARANPPPILYRYRKPNDWALAEISKPEIFVASPDDLNDPFECSAPVAWNVDSLRRSFIETYAPKIGLSAEAAATEFDSHPQHTMREMLRGGLAKIRQDSGIICLSAVPNSIRMWSYYAQAHEGICVGFNTQVAPFMMAMKVTYQNPDTPLDVAETLRVDPSELAAHITLRKAAEWEFEQEYRIPIGQIGSRPRLMPFNPSAIIEIRLGARLKDDFKINLMEAISYLPQRPKLIQMRCDLDRFVLTEEIIFS
jgi:hypothetical protein